MFGGSSSPTDSKKTTDSFISFNNNNDEYTIDFDTFKNCKQEEFLEFIDLIKPYAGDKSIYDYLRYVGFTVPRVDGTNALALGIEIRPDDEYNDRVHSNQTYPRVFIMYWINIDQKVKDISSNSFSKTWYTASLWYGGACNNRPEWRHNWVLHRGRPNSEQEENYSTPAYFVSLHGLSTSSKSGKISRGSLDTKW